MRRSTERSGERFTGQGDHPAPETLEAHLLGRPPGGTEEPDLSATLDHLASGCPVCVERARERLASRSAARRELVRALLRDGPAGSTEGGAVADLSRELTAWGALAAVEDAAAPVLEAELLAVPAPERAGEVRQNRRFQCAGLARHLAERAREEGFREPSRAVELAGLAVEVAESLEEAGYPSSAVKDEEARAWRTLGNARRLATDLFGAERAFRAARQHLAEGSGFPRDEIEHWSLLGSLRRAQTRFGDARGVLERGLALARRVGAEDLEGRIVLKLAKTLGDGGEPAAAVALLEEAAPLLDRPGERDQSHYRLQSLAVLLVEAGRPAEAREALERVREPWLARTAGAADRERLRWLEARVLWAEGDRPGAEAELLRVRDAFRDQGAWYDVALACLDLAVLYLEDGRTDEVRRLAAEMLPVFRSRALHRHAVTALVLFQRSALAEEATAAWVRALARYLRHARGNPFLPFEPPA